MREGHIAVIAGLRRHHATERCAALASGILRGANAQLAIRCKRQVGAAIGRLHDLDQRILVAQALGRGLDVLQGQFIVMGRMLAVALAEGFVEEARLPGGIVRAGRALGGVEDGGGQLAGEAAQLCL